MCTLTVSQGGIGVPVGADIVAIDRIAGDVQRWGDTFLARLLTPAETAWCTTADPLRPDVATNVAACLAAKEAVVKVLCGRPRGFTWHSVELVPDVRSGDRRECRALLARAGGDEGGEGFLASWRCVLDPAVAPEWLGVVIAAAAVTHGSHVVAVAAAD
jgi:phosphopantetheinyl transferase (holo-ACP synthase)